MRITVPNFMKISRDTVAEILCLTVFTARGYANRGICRRRVSLCVCVCHTPLLYQNG